MTRPATMQPGEAGVPPACGGESGNQNWPDDLRAAEYDGAEFGHLVMPVGGIGTGNLAISADGGLRQWQLHNIGNHEGRRRVMSWS